ncbi:MAG: tetratricopeptide repeat protein [Deltaproteobacteria bacterium]|nr:tetratricopeptide repeat protein [Deltaproteobacteria bacterium]
MRKFNIFYLSLFLLLYVSSSSAAAVKDDDKSGLRNVASPSIAFYIEKEPSKEEKSVLEEERKKDLEIYIKRTLDFNDIIAGSIDRVYNQRKEMIDSRYLSKIKAEDELEKAALMDAIAYFERFLKKYPDSPPYTPDAMFRLAELYYDVSYLDYLDYSDEFAAASDAGKADEMPLPEKDFEKSIKLFEALVEKYPDYENTDGAYYLLGYCLKEEGKDEEARLAWLNLVCPNKYKYDPVAIAKEKAERDSGATNPSASLNVGEPSDNTGVFVNPFAQCTPVVKNSRFFFESWWLIGNYHFDFDTSKYGVETAIAAYEKLITDKNHKFYDKGLYKLAWSYYKADMYPEAVKTFAEVVNFSDKQGIRNSSMVPEAVQYLAVCFFNEDWNMDMMPDSETAIDRLQDPQYLPQDKDWIKEVYERLGDIYSDNEKHDQAIEVWNLYLKKWPLDLQTPFVLDKIANSYRTQRKFEEELEARSKLDDFGQGSKWWEANSDRPDIQANVERMAQDALINSALSHHQQAQALRAEAKASGDTQIMEFALEEYNLAAQAYKKYITQNPDTPDAYDLNYQLADALFWSGQYNDAKKEYISVRDSNLDDKYREDSARMVIISLERIVEVQISEGKLVLRDAPPVVNPETKQPEQFNIPPILMELMNERELFLKNEPDSKDASTFNYQSAQNYYRYGQWKEAKDRYRKIYDTYCQKDEISVFSWKTLLNMAVEQDDLDAKEELAHLEEKKQCTKNLELTGDEGIELDNVLGDVAMQRAMNLFSKCMETKNPAICTEAGDKLVAAVNRAPKHPSADAALHNGALAYENADRNQTAMDLYGRIVEEYPDSQWVDKCLFKQAFAANKVFEYEKALSSYKILADQKRFQDSEYRIDAIMNTALILTNLQDYKKAVAYWQQFAAQTDDSESAIEASFKAADMYYSAKSWNTAIAEYDSFIKKNKNKEGAGPYIVKASYRIGLANHQKRAFNVEAATWKETVDYYNKYVDEPGSISAEYAAESQFNIVEQDMKKFESFSISGTQKVIDKKMTEGAEKVKEFETKYKDIQKFRRPVWSLAAEFRIGFTYEILAKAILNIPPPPLDNELQKQLKMLPQEDRDMVMSEYEDKFRAAMETHVEKMEERAQGEYKLAIEMARKGNISNEWSLLALERMNAYDPGNYPRQHNGLNSVIDDTVSVPSWAPEENK